MDVTQYACFSSSHQIILLGCKDEHQGIYTYDIDSGKTELLYESKNELINLNTHIPQVIVNIRNDSFNFLGIYV